MIHPFPRKLAGAFVLALLVLALAGCGRRGPLEPPPAGAPDSQTSAPQPGQGTAADSQPASNPAPASPDAAASLGPNPPPAPAKPGTVTPVLKSFPLDPLLN